MLEVFLDAGHGGKDSGATGHGLLEKDINLLICKEMISLGEQEKLIRFIPSRTTDTTLSLDERVSKEKSAKVKASVSVHCNAGGAGYGTETYYFSTSAEGKKLATEVNTLVHGVINRRNRGIKAGDSFAMVKRTASTAILVEVAFISDATDASILKTKVKEIAKAIYSGIKNTYGVSTPKPQPTPTPTIGTPIMHTSKATVEQMITFLNKNNKTPKITCSVRELCQFFLDEGAIEGVSGDIAFCQAIKESGWFRFGGDVVPEQNNYCGLGTTGGGVKGAYFETAQMGIRAQIQHLKAYASTEPLKKVCVDPRYSLVSKGSAKNWEDLNGKWAVPGNNYGQEILRLHKQLLTIVPDVVVEEKPIEPPISTTAYQVIIGNLDKEKAEQISSLIKALTGTQTSIVEK